MTRSSPTLHIETGKRNHEKPRKQPKVRSTHRIRFRAPTEERLCSRMSVPEVARRLEIGRLAVYAILEQGILPRIRLGRRWIITRYAYAQWERTCGMRRGAATSAEPVSVLKLILLAVSKGARTHRLRPDLGNFGQCATADMASVALAATKNV
jgi:excisionase family DNA binding protein